MCGNVVIDSDIYCIWEISGTNKSDVKSFQDINDEFDLVDKHRNEYPQEVAWIWNKSGISNAMESSSYIGRVHLIG